MEPGKGFEGNKDGIWLGEMDLKELTGKRERDQRFFLLFFFILVSVLRTRELKRILIKM